MSDSTEVKLHFLDYWRVIKARAGIIILTFLLTMITAGVTVYFMPREYYSTATIEVKPDATTSVNVYGEGGINVGSDPRLAPTQFKIIQEQEILYPVIDQLGLTTKWAAGGPPLQKQQAYGKLLGMLDMKEVRQTDLIEIGIWSTDKEEAAEIANSIALVYQDRRIADQTKRLETGLQRLKDEVNDQTKQVADMGAAAAKIRTEMGIVDPDPETMSNTAADLDMAPVKSIETEVDDAKAKTEELQTKLEQVNKLSTQELLVALHMLNIDDPTVQKILPLLQDTVDNEAALRSSGLGPNHPQIKKLEALQQEYTTQLNTAIAGIKATMATSLELAKTTQAAFEQRLKEARDQFTTEKNAGSDYNDAKYR
jgi:polysaccharide biosynthesis transport protein